MLAPAQAMPPKSGHEKVFFRDPQRSKSRNVILKFHFPPFTSLNVVFSRHE